MKKITFLLLAFITAAFFLACQQGGQWEQEIAKLEEQAEQAPSRANMEALVQKYQAYVEAHPVEDINRQDYLMKAAGLLFKMEEVYPSADLLRQSIRDYFPEEKTDESIIALANMQFLHMKDSLSGDSMLTLFKACFPGEDVLRDKLLYLIDVEGNLSNDSTLQKINREASLNFMNLSEMYGRLFPNTDEGAEHLLSAAKMATFFQQYKRALDLYEKVYTEHKGSEYAGNALFMTGFTFDNHLSNYEAAGRAFSAFIEEFPAHNLVPSARFLLENLGKSEDEIISSFKKEG
jgi:tetratricopeptide (TPR) repeat protein